MFDQALQFLLPIVLVRCLDAHTFGEYRLLWLAIGTVMAGIAGAILFFVFRAFGGAKPGSSAHMGLMAALIGFVLACCAILFVLSYVWV